MLLIPAIDLKNGKCRRPKPGDMNDPTPHGDDPAARAVMSEVYRPLSLNQAPLMFTSRRSAELIK